MFIYFVILFTVLPALELVLLIEIGSVIGSFNTIFLIIATGILGAALARYQGFYVLRDVQMSLNRGELPGDRITDGLMILVGGLVLLTPGFITDTIGFLLLIPWSRTLLKKIFKYYFQHRIGSDPRIHMFTERPRAPYDDIDISE